MFFYDRKVLVYFFNSYDLGYLFFHCAFDAHLKRLSCAGTTVAGALKLYLNDVIHYIDEFYVTAVGLKHRPYFLNYLLNFFFHYAPQNSQVILSDFNDYTPTLIIYQVFI